MKVAVGLRRVAAGKRTSGRRAAQIAVPVAGNAINAATAASITEGVGWLAVKEFTEHRERYEEEEEYPLDNDGEEEKNVGKRVIQKDFFTTI